MQSKVSVMMPAKNTGKFISEAIDSIVNQTYENWELIIIDDKSFDNTRIIAESYSKKDSRIKVFEGNGIGVANARNKVIDLASGEYIMLLDSDDVSVPERMIKLLEVAQKYSTIVAGSNISYVDLQLRVKYNSKKPLDNNKIRAGFNRLYNRNTIIPGTILARTELFQKYRYNEFYQILSDWDMILRMSENHNVNFINIENPLYLYRINNGSLTLDSRRAKYNLLVRYNEIQRRNKKKEVSSLETFDSIINKNLVSKFIYHFVLSCKKIQHKLILLKSNL